MDIEKAIEEYNQLRERIYELIRSDKKLLGEYAWLWPVIGASDISLEFGIDGINCYGYAYSSQTRDNEHFTFTIRADLLTKADMIEHGTNVLCNLDGTLPIKTAERYVEGLWNLGWRLDKEV